MKKLTCMLIALILCLTAACAFAQSVPSKTTADLVKAEVTFAVANSAAAEKIVFEVVTAVEETAVDAPVEVVEKKKASVEATNVQLEKLTTAIQAVAVPVVAEGAVLTETQQKEVAVAQTKVVEEYFGGVVSATGETQTLTEVLGTETVTVDEFFPMVVSGLEKDCGEAVMNLAVANVYSAQDKVVVLVGLVAEDGSIIWQAVETEVAEDGSLQVVFPEEMLLAMQDNTCVVSVARG